MQWTGERNGQYRATLRRPAEDGWYEAKLDATRDGQAGRHRRHARPRGARRRGVLRRDDARAAAEADRAGHRRPLLSRPTTMTSLPDDLKYSGRGVTAVEERELWHMPSCCMALVGDRLHRVGPAAVLEARVMRRAGARCVGRVAVSGAAAGARSAWRCSAPAFAQSTHLLIVVGLAGRSGARRAVQEVGDDARRHGDAEAGRRRRTT